MEKTDHLMMFNSYYVPLSHKRRLYQRGGMGNALATVPVYGNALVPTSMGNSGPSGIGAVSGMSPGVQMTPAPPGYMTPQSQRIDPPGTAVDSLFGDYWKDNSALYRNFSPSGNAFGLPPPIPTASSSALGTQYQTLDPGPTATRPDTGPLSSGPTANGVVPTDVLDPATPRLTSTVDALTQSSRADGPNPLVSSQPPLRPATSPVSDIQPESVQKLDSAFESITTLTPELSAEAQEFAAKVVEIMFGVNRELSVEGAFESIKKHFSALTSWLNRLDVASSVAIGASTLALLALTVYKLSRNSQKRRLATEQLKIALDNAMKKYVAGGGLELGKAAPISLAATIQNAQKVTPDVLKQLHSLSAQAFVFSSTMPGNGHVRAMSEAFFVCELLGKALNNKQEDTSLGPHRDFLVSTLQKFGAPFAEAIDSVKKGKEPAGSAGSWLPNLVPNFLRRGPQNNTYLQVSPATFMKDIPDMEGLKSVKIDLQDYLASAQKGNSGNVLFTFEGDTTKTIPVANLGAFLREASLDGGVWIDGLQSPLESSSEAANVIQGASDASLNAAVNGAPTQQQRELTKEMPQKPEQTSNAIEKATQSNTRTGQTVLAAKDAVIQNEMAKNLKAASNVDISRAFYETKPSPEARTRVKALKNQPEDTIKAVLAKPTKSEVDREVLNAIAEITRAKVAPVAVERAKVAAAKSEAAAVASNVLADITNSANISSNYYTPHYPVEYKAKKRSSRRRSRSRSRSRKVAYRTRSRRNSRSRSRSRSSRNVSRRRSPAKNRKRSRR